MAKARAALRRSQLGKKRPAADSLVSGDGPAVASKYRSKSLVIVYYDSYVQSFFEEVVKFVSASRNLMRKAKMAAKVAQIKRMAELEMPDDDNSSEASDGGFGNGMARFLPPRLSPSVTQNDGPSGTNGVSIGPEEQVSGHSVIEPKLDNGNTNEAPPAAIRTSPPHANGNETSFPSPSLPGRLRPSPAARPSLSPHSNERQPPGIFDELDKSLEFIQSMCEQAAHLFLRDGDCSDEIRKMQERLAKTKASADRELESMLESDADGSMQKLLMEGGFQRTRDCRPQTLRRDMVGSGATPTLKKSPIGGRCANGTSGEELNGHGAGTKLGDGPALEVDEDVGGNEACREEKPSKFEFRSTRQMGHQMATGL